jgi:hypothetical protein
LLSVVVLELTWIVVARILAPLPCKVSPALCLWSCIVPPLSHVCPLVQLSFSCARPLYCFSSGKLSEAQGLRIQHTLCWALLTMNTMNCICYSTLVFLHIHPSIHPPIYPSIHPSIHPCMHAFIHSFIYSFIHTLIQWVIPSLLHWFTDPLLNCFIDSLIPWLTFCFAGSLLHWFIVSLHYLLTHFWFIDSWIHWFIHSLVH